MYCDNNVDIAINNGKTSDNKLNCGNINCCWFTNTTIYILHVTKYCSEKVKKHWWLCAGIDEYGINTIKPEILF